MTDFTTKKCHFTESEKHDTWHLTIGKVPDDEERGILGGEMQVKRFTYDPAACTKASLLIPRMPGRTRNSFSVTPSRTSKG